MLRDALKLIFEDLSMHNHENIKICIMQDCDNFNVNIIGCVAASIIINYLETKNNFLNNYWFNVINNIF